MHEATDIRHLCRRRQSEERAGAGKCLMVVAVADQAARTLSEPACRRRFAGGLRL